MRLDLLQRQLDAALDASPRARELCSQLAGKRMELRVQGTPWQFVLRAEASRLVLAGTGVAAAAAEKPDVVITGTPLALLELATTQEMELVQRGVVQMTGDEELAQQFQLLTRLLRPDFEELIGRYAGRIPTHLALTGLRTALAWGRQSLHSVVKTSAEYLAHESRDLVPQAEAQQFQRSVEQLHEQLDRLEARVNGVAGRAS